MYKIKNTKSYEYNEYFAKHGCSPQMTPDSKHLPRDAQLCLQTTHGQYVQNFKNLSALMRKMDSMQLFTGRQL